MNVYNMYFSGMTANKKYLANYLNQTSVDVATHSSHGPSSTSFDDFSSLKECLERTDDFYLFIITKEQADSFKYVVDKYGYAKYLHYEMPDYVSNVNYMNGRRLKLYVFKGAGKNEV